MSAPSVSLPLLALFTRLRQADIPLGIDDYQLLLQALQAGFGLADRDALARLCRALWITSQEQEALFSYHFDQVFAQRGGRVAEESEHLTPDSQSGKTFLSADAPQRHRFAPAAPVAADMEDQAVWAVVHTASEQELPYPRFVRSDEYFPVTRRQIKQSWRSVRRPVREGPRTEPDREAAISEIGRRGSFLEPVLLLPRTYCRAVVLLIDQGGSMVPFQALSRRLVEGVVRSGRPGEVAVYSFHNCPADYLYREPTHRGAVALQDIIECAQSASCSVVIVSDAGAARRTFSPQRWEMTARFLLQCDRRFRALVWLNPTLRTRRAGTTAERICRSVPMFDVSRRGVDAALGTLRRGREGRMRQKGTGRAL